MTYGSLRVLLHRKAVVGLTLCCLWALQGCCWMAKRSCFPACPPTLPARIVTLEKPCKLPPLKVPGAKRSECPAAIGAWSCYEPVEAGKLAKRLADMKDWIVSARSRCGSPASAPASAPTH